MQAKRTEILAYSLDEAGRATGFAERVYRAAIAYVSAGFHILPIRPNGKILPPKRTGVNYSSATSSLTTAEEWFNPETGTFAGYNIAIACGLERGVFVVDIDAHGDVDGHKSWSMLTEKHGHVPTMQAKTPNNGTHLVYEWFEGGISSQDKLGEGIDTRGGYEAAAASHIVVYPSEINGDMYEWDGVLGVAPAPEWLKSVFSAGLPTGFTDKARNAGGSRGNENIEEGDTYRPFSDDEITDMLEHINPDALPYEDWVKVGMALHRDRPVSGLDIWDKWSRQGSRYEDGECATRWDGFDVEGYPLQPVSMGTLVHMAKSFGWSRQPTPEAMSEIQQAIADMNAECFVNLASNGFKVCIESPHGIRYMNRADLVNHYSNKAFLVDGKIKNPADLWLSSPERRELMGFRFDPSKTKEQSEEEDGVYNTFRGFPVPAVDHGHKGVKLYTDFVRDVIARGDQTVADWVLDWIADIFQNPAEPKGTSLVLVGEEGTGKGMFASMLQPLLGRHYIKDNAGLKISGRFNDFLEEAILLFADEMTSSVGRKAQQTIKAIITGDELLLEGKGVDARSAFLVSRVIIASNDYEVIRGEKTSRRFLSLDISSARRNDHEYFGKLVELLSSEEYLESLMYFLMNRDIGNGYHLRKAPETELLRQQKIANLTRENECVTWVIGVIEAGSFELPDVHSFDGDLDGWARAIKRTDIKQAYENWCMALRKEPSTSLKLYRTLRALGFKDEVHVQGGRNTATFEVPPLEQLKTNVADYLGVTWESIDVLN